MTTLLGGGPSAPSVLAPASIEGMLAPGREIVEGISWGYGWGIQEALGERSFWHWGNNNNVYHAFAVGYPDHGLGVVVLTNSGGGLKLCSELVPAAVGGDHPAFRWPLVLPA